MKWKEVACRSFTSPRNVYLDLCPTWTINNGPDSSFGRSNTDLCACCLLWSTKRKQEPRDGSFGSTTEVEWGKLPNAPSKIHLRRVRIHATSSASPGNARSCCFLPIFCVTMGSESNYPRWATKRRNQTAAPDPASSRTALPP